MNRTASGDGEGGGGRIAVTALLVLAVAIGMLLLVRARPEPGAFDPRSGRPDGTRALVLLLESQGVIVDVGKAVPRPGTATRVLIVADASPDFFAFDLHIQVGIRKAHRAVMPRGAALGLAGFHEERP